MAATGRHAQITSAAAWAVQDWLTLVLVVGLSLTPPFLYTLWLRAKERHDRNPLRVVTGAFFYGGTVGVAVAILLHMVFEVGFAAPNANFGLEKNFVSVVIAAPIVEEIAKGLGFWFVRPHIRELEDGLVYGAAIGLGFAATENLLYGVDALNTVGLDLALWTIVLRILSSMLLHLGSSAILGFGFARVALGNGFGLLLIPYYLVAAALHATYNFLVTLPGVGLWALGTALVMVVFVVSVLQRRIEVLDSLPHEQHS